MIVPRRCSRSLLPHPRSPVCLSTACRRLRSPGVCRFPASAGNPSSRVVNGNPIFRLGCGAPSTLIVGVGFGAMLHGLWSQIPIWPFALAGLLLPLALAILYGVAVLVEMWFPEQMEDIDP